ncbi:hypothetical protein HDU76_002091 [Blyttiomyces sp. JEL0837]|nr:hypothetical protein HDU76_002091 [Blyttiomyces sp. JEL0837]
MKKKLNQNVLSRATFTWNVDLCGLPSGGICKGTYYASNFILSFRAGKDKECAGIGEVTSSRTAETVGPASARSSHIPPAIQKLPYIVGVNPFIRSVYQLYLDSFETLSAIPAPVDDASQAKFAQTLSDLVASHQDVIPKLAKGFLECGKYMTKEDSTSFLDGMIHARIAIRVLAEHHLALQEPVQGWIGIVNTRLKPSALIRSTSEYVQELCEINYGSAPDFDINGRVDTTLAYISVHLEYILMELIKNANRATVEHSHRIGRDEHPKIEVTIAQGKDDVTIRIRDQGGGIAAEEMRRVFEYSYTTVPKAELDESNIFTTQARMNMQAGVGGPIAGLGFGLPMSRIYAKYFGGSLELRSVTGHGLDVFLRVPSITLPNTSQQLI